MNVLIAQTAGFCMGVDLALRKLDAALAERPLDGRIHTLGPIIHNPQVLERYASQGVRLTDGQATMNALDTVIIRAHGVPRWQQEQLESHGASIVDATCPKVKRAQLLIQKQAALGKHLLLFGEQEHPEVRGLLSYAKGATVFESMEELQQIPLDADGHYFLAAQTTQDLAAMSEIRAFLQAQFADLVALDTICTATKDRQDEVRTLATQVDAIVVVGGRESGNTRRLAQIAAESGKFALHIETSDELPVADLQRYTRVGLTAGASTPAWIIDDVAQTLRSLAPAV